MDSLETRVTAVVVYPDRARVTRQGQAQLENGLHQIEIAGLPVRLNPDSARASARGTAARACLACRCSELSIPRRPPSRCAPWKSSSKLLKTRWLHWKRRCPW